MGAGQTGRGIWPGTYPLGAESQGFAVASSPISSLLLSLVLSLPSRAFSSEMGSGSRKENASKQEARASVPIQSERRL
jgi:hypothetical protein